MSSSSHRIGQLQFILRLAASLLGVALLVSFFLPLYEMASYGRGETVFTAYGLFAQGLHNFYLGLIPLAAAAVMLGQLIPNGGTRGHLTILCGAIAVAVPYDHLAQVRWVVRGAGAGAQLATLVGFGLLVVGVSGLLAHVATTQRGKARTALQVMRSGAGLCLFASFFFPWFWVATVILTVDPIFGWSLMLPFFLAALSYTYFLRFSDGGGRLADGAPAHLVTGLVAIGLTTGSFLLFELQVFEQPWLTRIGIGWILAFIGGYLAVMMSVGPTARRLGLQTPQRTSQMGGEDDTVGR